MGNPTFKCAEIFLISLIVCILTQASAKQLIRLHSGLDCPEVGYFRDAVDCKRFYYCPNEASEESRLGILTDEEKFAVNQIKEKGVECPDGTFFDETVIKCQNVLLMDIIPPECNLSQLYQPHAVIKDGAVIENPNNDILR